MTGFFLLLCFSRKKDSTTRSFNLIIVSCAQQPKSRPDDSGYRDEGCLARARTWTFLIQSQTCCQLHHEAKYIIDLLCKRSWILTC